MGRGKSLLINKMEETRRVFAVCANFGNAGVDGCTPVKYSDWQIPPPYVWLSNWAVKRPNAGLMAH